MYIVYKTTNLINNKFYFGVHKQIKDDTYLGSGRALRKAIIKYGKNNFKRETVKIFLLKEEAFQYEKKIIDEHLSNPLCYNLMSGGQGGFEHINSNPVRINPMNVPVYKERQKHSAKSRLQSDKEWADRKRSIAVANVKKASQSNIGRTRPEHSELMSRKSNLILLMKDKEKFRDLLSSNFEVVSPDGETYNTNRLQDFCNERALGYASLWNTSRTGKPVTKGKSKGWICKKT